MKTFKDKIKVINGEIMGAIEWICMDVGNNNHDLGGMNLIKLSDVGQSFNIDTDSKLEWAGNGYFHDKDGHTYDYSVCTVEMLAEFLDVLIEYTIKLKVKEQAELLKLKPAEDRTDECISAIALLINDEMEDKYFNEFDNWYDGLNDKIRSELALAVNVI